MEWLHPIESLLEITAALWLLTIVFPPVKRAWPTRGVRES